MGCLKELVMQHSTEGSKDARQRLRHGGETIIEASLCQRQESCVAVASPPDACWRTRASTDVQTAMDRAGVTGMEGSVW